MPEKNTEEELGDLLFRRCKFIKAFEGRPRNLLCTKACVKFTDRFRLVEKEVLESGKPWSEFSLEELDGFWEKAKKRAGNRQAIGGKQ